MLHAEYFNLQQPQQDILGLNFKYFFQVHIFKKILSTSFCILVNPYSYKILQETINQLVKTYIVTVYVTYLINASVAAVEN